VSEHEPHGELGRCFCSRCGTKAQNYTRLRQLKTPARGMFAYARESQLDPEEIAVALDVLEEEGYPAALRYLMKFPPFAGRVHAAKRRAISDNAKDGRTAYGAELDRQGGISTE